MNVRIRQAGVVAAALALGAFLTAGPAGAGSISDNAARAEQLLGLGEPADAMTAFDQATDAFWQASPLQFRKILFADSVAGYGRYAEHQGTVFKAGDAPVVYFEPVGYGFGTESGGTRIAFSAGIEIRTPGGLILAKTGDFADLAWTGAGKTREFYGSLGITLPALKPGPYQLIMTITDSVSSKTATATLPFDIGA